MNEDRLISLIEKPEIQYNILRNYQGDAYSIGVAHDNAHLGIRIRIEGEVVDQIPSSILLDGEEIPIYAQAGFQAPWPL